MSLILNYSAGCECRRLKGSKCDAAFEFRSSILDRLLPKLINKLDLHLSKMQALSYKRIRHIPAFKRKLYTTCFRRRGPGSNNTQLECADVACFPKLQRSVTIVDGIHYILDIEIHGADYHYLIKSYIESIIICYFDHDIGMVSVILHYAAIHVKIWLKIPQTYSDLLSRNFDLLLYRYPSGARGDRGDEGCKQSLIAIEPELKTGSRFTAACSFLHHRDAAEAGVRGEPRYPYEQAEQRQQENREAPIHALLSGLKLDQFASKITSGGESAA